MSVKKNDLVQFIGGLQTLTDEVPEIMTKIAVGEGVYAVKQARLICTNDSPDIVNTGRLPSELEKRPDREARRPPVHRPFLQPPGLCRPPGTRIPKSLRPWSLGRPHVRL